VTGFDSRFDPAALAALDSAGPHEAGPADRHHAGDDERRAATRQTGEGIEGAIGRVPVPWAASIAPTTTNAAPNVAANARGRST